MKKRLEILKTYKIYIGGKFPRTESGRFYELTGRNGVPIANICRSSRKDFRNSVVAARKAFPGWSGRTAYNRAQILYRIAEMLEGRREQFVSELRLQGESAGKALSEVNGSIDRLIYYAGWADKYVHVCGSFNGELRAKKVILALKTSKNKACSGVAWTGRWSMTTCARITIGSRPRWVCPVMPTRKSGGPLVIPIHCHRCRCGRTVR